MYSMGGCNPSSLFFIRRKMMKTKEELIKEIVDLKRTLRSKDKMIEELCRDYDIIEKALGITLKDLKIEQIEKCGPQTLVRLDNKDALLECITQSRAFHEFASRLPDSFDSRGLRIHLSYEQPREQKEMVYKTVTGDITREIIAPRTQRPNMQGREFTSKSYTSEFMGNYLGTSTYDKQGNLLTDGANLKNPKRKDVIREYYYEW